MFSKKIIIISRSFYPQLRPRAFRSTELAKEFAKQGHDVTVIVPKTDMHDEFERRYKIKIEDLGKPKWRTVNIKGKGAELLIRKALNKIIYWLFEYPNIELIWLVGKALKNKEGYDMLISVAHPYPIHWGVARSWKKGQKTAKVWIADCGDPYMGNENSSQKPPFYFKWVEKWFMKKVDYISVPTESSIQGYYPEFHQKLRVIPQGFCFEEIEVCKEYSRGNKVVFGYAGMFIPGRRDPSEFLEFINSLDDSFKFEFHVYTHNPNVIKPFLEAGNGRIKLLEIRPRKQVLYELSKMDFVVNFENVGTKQIPSKLIDYGIINKPVLSVKYGNLNKAVVIEFLKEDYKNRMQLPDLNKYRIENIIRSFLSLIEESSHHKPCSTGKI